jgi:hypothetical protein
MENLVSHDDSTASNLPSLKPSSPDKRWDGLSSWAGIADVAPIPAVSKHSPNNVTTSTDSQNEPDQSNAATVARGEAQRSLLPCDPAGLRRLAGYMPIKAASDCTLPPTETVPIQYVGNAARSINGSLPGDKERVLWYCRGYKINPSVERRKCCMMPALEKDCANWRREITHILSRLKGFSLAAFPLLDSVITFLKTASVTAHKGNTDC